MIKLLFCLYSIRAAKLRFFSHILSLEANKNDYLILKTPRHRYTDMKKRQSKPVETIPAMEGYEAELRTIGMLKANIVAMLVLVLLGLLGWAAMYAIWGGFSLGNPWNGMLFIVGFWVGVAVHELIHGFTWMWVTHSSFRHLRFGLLRGGVYCHIDVPMSKRKYVVGALMPLLLLGILPFLLSFATQSLWLMLFGVIFIGCAMGDVLIVWAIRKESSDTLVYDHPSEPGCVVYKRDKNEECG